MAIQVQLRGDTAANWTTVNPILANREVGLETDTQRWKAGDGTTLWAALPYYDSKGDMLAATYDPTAIAGDAFSMDNMVEGVATKVLTATERTAIAANTAKVGITAAQAADIVTNNAKVSDVNHVALLLPNVDNTSDANKPVSTATQTALNLKEDGLGNPTVDGYVLSSTTTGTRSWVAGGGGGALDMPVVAHALAYTAVLADKGKLIDTIGTWTLGLDAAAILGDGWTLAVHNSGAATDVITIDANGAETIGGSLTYIVRAGASVLITCDGLRFLVVATSGGITSEPSVAATSGTSIDFTSIPSDVVRVTANLSGVSLITGEQLLLQLGTGSSPTTSGYSGYASMIVGGAVASSALTTGFLLRGGDPTAVYSGQFVLTRVDPSTNEWVCSAVVSMAGLLVNITAGAITLSGQLGMVRLTSVAGTATFNTGKVSIIYE